MKAKGSQSCHRKTTTTGCYPYPAHSGLSSCRLHDPFQPTQTPIHTLRRDTGQVIILTSDISRSIYAYISYPVPLVHLGLITHILCSDQLKWRSSSLHTNLSRLPTYYLKSKTNISAAHCFRTIFIHKISSVFLYKKKKSTTQTHQVTRLKNNTTSSPRPIHAFSIRRRHRCNYTECAAKSNKVCIHFGTQCRKYTNFAFITRYSVAGQILLGVLLIRCVASILIWTVQRGHRYLRPSNSTTRFPFSIRVRD